jgi:type IV secretion system protein VirD4
MNQRNDWDDEIVFALGAGLAVMLAAGYLLGALPVAVWSLASGDPRIPGFTDAVAVTLGAVPGRPPAGVAGPRRELVWIVDLFAVAIAALPMAAVVMRVDRWRSQEVVARSRLNPRSWVTSRAFARPRDLLHLVDRPRSIVDRGRVPVVALQRLLVGDKRRPADADGDGWPLGRLGGRKGRPIRSLGEMGMCVVGATRSGKSSRVLTPALLELDDSPAVVLSNKADVLVESLAARSTRGPVWVIAPMTPANALPITASAWSPLGDCATWEGALRTAGWLLDADPGATASAQDSGGARFYNREATAAPLPACLHAAAISGRSMADVLGWLRAGVAGLDEPRDVLREHGAPGVADVIVGVQELDERPRSLLLMSAAQLLDVYRFPSVQEADCRGFDPAQLLDGGTLYVLAPQAQQDSLAPLFGALLGSVLKVWEQHALATGRGSQRLHVLVDEAANLAPLTSLPTHLAVSAGWGVRWLLAYQTIGQIEHRYGHEAHAILGNLLCKAFLGPVHDTATGEYVDALLGERTVTARSWNVGSMGAGGSTTRHERQASKVSRPALAQLAEGEGLVVHGRDLPFVSYFPATWERRGGRQR